MYNFRTRNHPEINSNDQDDDVTYQLHLSRVNVSVTFKFTTCQEVEKKREWFFPFETLSVNYSIKEVLVLCFMLSKTSLTVFKNCSLCMHVYLTCQTWGVAKLFGRLQ